MPPKLNKDCSIKPKNSKKWDKDEEESMLLFMQAVVMHGREIEKPNAKIFYERMLIDLKLDATVAQAMYKVGVLKKTYTDVSKLLKQTGEGVEPGSEIANHKDKCKYYDLLHDIYGAINPPYVYESSSLTNTGVAFTYNQDLHSVDDIIEYDPDYNDNEWEFDQRMYEIHSFTTDMTTAHDHILNFLVKW